MTTWTLEPLSFNLDNGVGLNVTQAQLGGSMPDCVKIPYASDGMPWNVQKGADRIAKLMDNGAIQPGDTVAGFSLGSQTVALYLSQHKPLQGVKFLLLGMTFWRNQNLYETGSRALGTGPVPWDIENEVTFVANEFDGYSDQPDTKDAPNFAIAQANAWMGTQFVHNYVNASLDAPENVVTQKGNITAILIPTKQLPINMWMRMLGNYANADAADLKLRAEIESAYSGQRPTVSQVNSVSAAAQQVGYPAAAMTNRPEPIANVT